MDSLIFQAMAVELNGKLANSRLDKVQQPGAGLLLLKFWTGQDKHQLLFQAEGRGAFFLTQQPYAAPAKPPRFCQLLRARLRRLLEVRAEPMDRVVTFRFSGPDAAVYDLIFEAPGTQANLILVDDAGRIVDLLHRQDGKRRLLPGAPYHLPEQPERLSLFAHTDDVASALLAAEAAGDAGRANLYPLSPALAHALTTALHHGQNLAAVVMRIKEAFAAGSFQPQRITWEGQSGYLPVPLWPQDAASELYPDLSSMVESTLLADQRETLKDQANRMAAVIKKQRQRLTRRIEHIAEEATRQADPERFRICGELLLANLHHVKRGAGAVEVDDFYQSPPTRTTIELDGRATPQENAERYFKLYRKAKRSGDHHARRLSETEEELAWLDQVALSLEESRSGDDLYQVQLELATAGLLKDLRGQLGKRPQQRPEDQLNQALTPSGWQLYWGKNSRTNDYVSRNLTAGGDLWFHAKGMPGAHLVLKCGDHAAKVAETDVLFAAAIAAGYSKGKDAAKVEVIVAPGQAVSKPKGAKPGLVSVDRYRSVLVAPTRITDESA